MLNGFPLNALPLNSLGGGQEEPVYVVRGFAFTWRLRLLIDGQDVTERLAGTVDVDREEGAAAVSGFDLFMPPGTTVVPSDWAGKAVVLEYISVSAGITAVGRRFSGRLTEPVWNPVTRLLSCECSDRLQQRTEALSVAEIDALVGGHWSADVFEPVQGRSHWDYAQERLSTRTASLDCSPYGDMRVTSWYAAQPHFVFGAGTTLYQSLALDLPSLDTVTNRVELEINYRYPRLWQFNQSFGWVHPGMGGFSGIQGFCHWRPWSTELPTTDMIESAVTGAGMVIIGSVGGFKLPLSMSDPCGDGNPWINTFDDLWLAVGVIGGRRWTQSVTETYNLALATPAGEVEGTRTVARESVSLDIEDDRAEEWDGSLEEDPSGDSSVEDLSDEARRQAALICVLRRAEAKIISAHRGSLVSWSVPTSMALGVDLVHTLQLDDQGAKALGKCVRIRDSFDLESGEAVSTLTIAVMRGGGVSDPLTVPSAPDTSLPPLEGPGAGLPTQLGGRVFDPDGNPIPPYDDERDGFSGNYSLADDATAVSFPRRIDVDARDIPAEYRDERTATRNVLYRVGVPNDQLEL
ncbi:hypothetical protein [Pseudomonas indica]|uniref:Uncharacterized protein n=1 Tax=Pseudomonas indica TaxID=137658 RepID=A0A1G8V5X3_9PSED|nr:hypothetical protein [Pseudomonas indica]SDJ61482.1 hypothetical protein SAMN05216186_102110 [Pseudomonas indica]